MDLPWCLTNTSSHLPMRDSLEHEPSSRNDNDEIMVKVESTPSKARRRIRRLQVSHDGNRLSSRSIWAFKKVQVATDVLHGINAGPITDKAMPRRMSSTLSSSSWGNLDTTTCHFEQLIKETSPAQPHENNVQERLSRKSSWALLDVGLDPEDRFGDDPILLSRDNGQVSLAVNSSHSKSSWAGLDIFGEIDLYGQQLHSQDETGRSGDISTDSTASESDEDEDEGDESTDLSDEPTGLRLWLDFQLDAQYASDAEREAWDSDDDASSSAEEEDESESEDEE